MVGIKSRLKKLPSLRFREFDGEWPLHDLRDAANIFDGTHQTPKYTATGVPFVSVENVTDPQRPTKFISAGAFQRDFKNKPQAGDILMTRITAGVIGATAIVNNDEPLAYYVSLALIRSNDTVDSSFLRHQIEGRRFKKELHRRIIHVAFPKKINLGDIGGCSITLPSLPEQRKIADFLTAVDGRIQQLSQKRALLQDY